jgi:hypothetical protein
MNDTTTKATKAPKPDQDALEELATRNALLEQDLEQVLSIPGVEKLLEKEMIRKTKEHERNERDRIKAEKKEREQARKEAEKAAKDADKIKMRMEAPEIAHHRNTSLVYGLCTGIFGATAILGRSPVVGVLTVTSGIRTGREVVRWQHAVRDYKAAQDEETIVTPPTAAEIMEGETKDYALTSALHMTDALAYSVLAMAFKSPVFLLFAIIDGYGGMQNIGNAMRSSDELEKYLQQYGPQAKPDYEVQPQRVYA